MTCNNDTCDPGEDWHNCSSDCISGDATGTEEACFKGVADGNCHPVKEDETCVDCSSGYCCGDGICNGDESSANCALDCGGGSSEICNNGIDDDGDDKIDCADQDCAADPKCACSVKKEQCEQDSDCCSNRCSRKGVCL